MLRPHARSCRSKEEEIEYTAILGEGDGFRQRELLLIDIEINVLVINLVDPSSTYNVKKLF